LAGLKAAAIFIDPDVVPGPNGPFFAGSKAAFSATPPQPWNHPTISASAVALEKLLKKKSVAAQPVELANARVINGGSHRCHIDFAFMISS
jgi:hypothetical protein